MNVDEVRTLLDKYIAETITDVERRRLSRMLETPAGRKALEQIIDREFAEGIYLNSRDENRFHAIYAHLNTIRKDVAEKEYDHAATAAGKKYPRTAEQADRGNREDEWTGAPGKIRKLFKWRLPAAAATVICVAGLLYYFFNTPAAPSQPPVARTEAVHDALPGKYGAVLTLSDGRRIALDSAAPGRIDIAGSAVVLKNGDQLQYHNEPSGSAAEQLYHTLTTAKGEIYSLTLSDGTRVWLNSASSIRFPVSFGAAYREVAVTGEAYFEVAKNEQKRFLVDAGGVVTEVLGTKFNVNAYPDETRTAITLLEGSVKIFNEKHSVHLLPGEQARVGGGMEQRRSAVPGVVNSIDPAAAVAWKDGYFHFNDADLPTVMRQLARWYDVDVVYTSDIPKRRFGGKMEKDLLLSQVLKILEKSEVNFTVDGNKLLVSP